ncbi:hypothetical protein OAS86_02170 [Gammaproteobacteria bacterium]|nr:hypothetical protein [Gammaproteobacteria bacterium]
MYDGNFSFRACSVDLAQFDGAYLVVGGDPLTTNTAIEVSDLDHMVLGFIVVNELSVSDITTDSLLIALCAASYELELMLLSEDPDIEIGFFHEAVSQFLDTGTHHTNQSSACFDADGYLHDYHDEFLVAA